MKSLSRSERLGINAACGVKWIIRQLSVLDRRCVEKAKSKNWPYWLGHLPLVMLALLLVLLGFYSLIIMLPLFFVVAIALFLMNFSNELPWFIDEITETTSVTEKEGPFNDDGLREGVDGLGFYVDGHRIDND